ncbi:hypothetical protein ACE1CI_03360 [Aerosakkonemataceae cyanobacterium BLCC-F50]|uniref:Uncharacterized protein n=1 Tax=Floridaenema flaviceps BLCC-F50 TaxID=3153642 RepID=A0ABV4XK76_9CYAN
MRLLPLRGMGLMFFWILVMQEIIDRLNPPYVDTSYVVFESQSFSELLEIAQLARVIDSTVKTVFVGQFLYVVSSEVLPQ